MRPESYWVISTLLPEAGGPYRMRRNHNPDVDTKSDGMIGCPAAYQEAAVVAYDTAFYVLFN